MDFQFVIALLILSFCSSTFANSVKIRSDYVPNSGLLNAVNRNQYMETRNVANGPFTPLMTRRKLYRGLQEPRHIYRNAINVAVSERQRLNQDMVLSPVPLRTYRIHTIPQSAYGVPRKYLRSSLPTLMEVYGRRRTIYPRCLQSFYEFFGLSPKPALKESSKPIEGNTVSIVAAVPVAFVDTPEPTSMNINTMTTDILPIVPMPISAPISVTDPNSAHTNLEASNLNSGTLSSSVTVQDAIANDITVPGNADLSIASFIPDAYINTMTTDILPIVPMPISAPISVTDPNSANTNLEASNLNSGTLSSSVTVQDAIANDITVPGNADLSIASFIPDAYINTMTTDILPIVPMPISAPISAPISVTDPNSANTNLEASNLDSGTLSSSVAVQDAIANDITLPGNADLTIASFIPDALMPLIHSETETAIKNAETDTTLQIGEAQTTLEEAVAGSMIQIGESQTKIKNAEAETSVQNAVTESTVSVVDTSVTTEIKENDSKLSVPQELETSDALPRPPTLYGNNS